MEPLPETREALEQISSMSDVDLVTVTTREANRVVDAVPGCLGLSVTLRDHELTFTWLATDDRLRTLDAAQFLEGGPCERAAAEGSELSVPDLMAEEPWRLLGLAGAARGVRSSLSLPLMGATGPIGSINLYGSDRDTFTGRALRIAEIYGADVSAAVSNADLSMTSRVRARRAVETLQDIDRVDIATGILAERENISLDEALARLREAADRADTPLPVLADIVISRKEDAS